MSRATKRRLTSLTVDDLLRLSPWFGQISAAAQMEVRDSVYERTITANGVLSHRGEIQHYWVGVLEGLLTWSNMTVDGQIVAFTGQGPGAWFGEGSLLRGLPRQSELIALRQARVALLPAGVFHWLRKTEPSFSDFILMQINERLHWFMANFAGYGLLGPDRLVARALASLMHPLANPLGEHHLQITQEELARLAAVSRPRCNESLMNLKSKGLVEVAYGAITILDLEGVIKIGAE